MVVDDTKENLRILVEDLGKEGYKVRPALNGQSALEAARKETPDLILLDIIMPGMDGYQVCDALKADKDLKDVPVIFISALDQVGDKVKGFSTGGVDYISKPFQAEEVLARVETHLTLRHLRKELEEKNTRLQQTNEQLKVEIEERKQAEEKRIMLESHLQQNTKMEAIANLAGGVAHEFNNALMGVMGNIELLELDLPENDGMNESFEAMKGSVHRMSRLTNQLLAYARGGQYQPRDLKLDDFVIETLPILQHDLRSEIKVETHFPKSIPYIRADHAQMQMVLSAILVNSNEAIEDEGLIRITAENKGIDEDFINEHPGLKPGPHVCLTVEDDGKGMDEETTKGIFEPFFTTKFQGRGMGMAAAYGIIKSHDGAITVDSEPGKGTVVRIYLPAIEAKEEVNKKVVPRPTVERTTGEGTILVIEDEEPLVMMFRQILERLGYRVLQARTGKEAVEFAKTFDGRIDLALLDIKLPDMEGSKVYPLIMEARPDLKVIVCSGYSIDGPAQDILDAGAEGFIQKPFSIAPFSEKLKEVLEGNRS